MELTKEIYINGKLHLCAVFHLSILHLWITQQCKYTVTVQKQFTLREKCPNTELFISLLRKSPYSIRIQEDTDQK